MSGIGGSVAEYGAYRNVAISLVIIIYLLISKRIELTLVN
jgi:hypothetical protein